MRRLGGLLPVLLAVAFCWLLSSGGSCSRDGATALVRVADVVPREVEIGERLAIIGDGFPAGRSARVTFRGTLHRPGEKPERGAEIVASGAAVGAQQLEIPFTEATQALFAGAGDRAAHTTFEGDVEVAFSAAIAGAPPIAGVLEHVTLDVRPSATPADADRDAEGTRLLAWTGLETEVGPSGLLVRSVREGSRAAAAGFVAGETLVAVEGVRVASRGDVLLAPGERVASVVVRRADGAESMRTLAVDGFRRAPPADLVGAALVVLSALALVVLLGAPWGFGLSRTLQAMVSRLRGSSRPSLRAALAEALPPAGPLALVEAAACGVLAALPFGQYLVAAQLDVGLLFVAAATSLTMAALLAGGSVWRGIRAAAHVALQHAPAAVAVVAVVATTGSLRIQEIERAQGGWPWDWLAFRSPGALFAFVALLACARIEPDAPDAPPGVRAFVRDAASPPPRGPWLEATCRAHRLVVAGLASSLFLGGWLLPGLTVAVQNASPMLQLAGAAWLLAKTAALVVLVTWSRAVLSQARLGERSRTAAVWLVPASLASLLATAGWSYWSPARATQLLVSGSLVALVVLVVLAMIHRVRYGVLSPVGDGRVSPFL